MTPEILYRQCWSNGFAERWQAGRTIREAVGPLQGIDARGSSYWTEALDLDGSVRRVTRREWLDR